MAASFSLTKIANEREDRINHGHIGIICNNEFKHYNFVFLKQEIPERQQQEEAAALLVASIIYKETVDKNFDIHIPGLIRVVNKIDE